MNTDKTNEFNERIWKIWHDNPRLAGDRIPKFVLPPESTEDRLVYLSLNPSFPKQIKKGFMAEICQESNLTYPTDFIWSNSPLKDKFDAALACKYAQVHRLSRSHYSWDDNLKEVAGNDKYGHVDLFFAADTKFACLPEPYHDENNYVSKIANFVQQQLDLSYEYLKGHKPKVIIAVYKRAAEIFLKYHNSRTNQTSVSLEKNKPFQKIDLNFDKLKMLLIVCNDLPGMRNRTLEEKSEMIKGIKKLVAEAKNGQ